MQSLNMSLISIIFNLPHNLCPNGHGINALFSNRSNKSKHFQKEALESQTNEKGEIYHAQKQINGFMFAFVNACYGF